MKRLFSAKAFAATAIALGAVGVASVAHARSDVVFSIGVQAPYGYVQPAPVYVQPQPVYVQPQTIYYGQQHYVQRRGPYGDRDGDGIANRFDRDSHRNWRHSRFGPRGDLDHDGVPNRYDRAPDNAHRR